MRNPGNDLINAMSPKDGRKDPFYCGEVGTLCICVRREVKNRAMTNDPVDNNPVYRRVKRARPGPPIPASRESTGVVSCGTDSAGIIVVGDTATSANISLPKAEGSRRYARP